MVLKAVRSEIVNVKIHFKPHISMNKKEKEKTPLGGIKTMIFLSWNKSDKIPKNFFNALALRCVVSNELAVIFLTRCISYISLEI